SELGHHAERGADLSGRAVPALKRVVLDERRLQGMDAVAGNALDGGDLPAFVLHGQRQAGIDALAVHQHRARAAGTLVASLLRPREPDMLTEGVEQRHTRVQPELVLHAVDTQADRDSVEDLGAFGDARCTHVDPPWQAEPEAFGGCNDKATEAA